MKNDFIQELYNLYSSKKMKNFFEFAQGEKRALLEFKLAKGDISPSDLCQKLSVSKQRITSILNSLYEKKYITININKKQIRQRNMADLLLFDVVAINYFSQKNQAKKENQISNNQINE